MNDHRATETVLTAEQTILAAVLMGDREAVKTVQAAGLTAEHFYLPAHQTIWRAAQDVAGSGQIPDPIAVSGRLEATGELASVGGLSGLMDVGAYRPIIRTDTANAIKCVLDATKRRLLASFAAEVGEYSGNGLNSAEEALAFAERQMSKLRDRCGVKSSTGMADALMNVVGNLEWRLTHPGAVRGIPSGFRRLDHTLDGLQPGAMIVIAARPGVGKTAALLNILTHVAFSGTPVGIFSLEMPREQLLERILYGLAGINADEVRRGTPLTVGQTAAFRAAMRKVREAPLHIDDESALPIEEITARARRMVAEQGVKLIGVDYLQLCRSTSPQARSSREREVSEISAGLKALAKELKVPVIVLAQLNRESEKATGKSRGIPQTSHLRDSGSIEQDADQIIMLHRPIMYATGAEKEPIPPDRAEWFIRKNRFGRTGTIDFTWCAQLTRYTENPLISLPIHQ